MTTSGPARRPWRCSSCAGDRPGERQTRRPASTGPGLHCRPRAAGDPPRLQGPAPSTTRQQQTNEGRAPKPLQTLFDARAAKAHNKAGRFRRRQGICIQSSTLPTPLNFLREPRGSHSGAPDARPSAQCASAAAQDCVLPSSNGSRKPSSQLAASILQSATSAVGDGGMRAEVRIAAHLFLRQSEHACAHVPQHSR